MPEGDTIFRAARALHRALAGQKVIGFETGYAKLARTSDDAPLPGRTVESVEARGKWMLMRFSGDLILVTHMLMNGTWHMYRPGERWHRPRSQMRIWLRTEPPAEAAANHGWEVVAFRVPVAEFHTSDSLARHRSIPALGPDLLAPAYDPAGGALKLAAYAAAHPDAEIANVLLNQRVLAGIGNVYKSEICFATGVHPFRRMLSITPSELESISETARKYMTDNVREGARGGIVTFTGLRSTTGSSRPGDRLWVYGRQGKECRRCGATIRMQKQGTGARTTFWCPQCQPL